MNRRFEYNFFQYLKQIERMINIRPLNLGGSSGSSGGGGGPPGGFTGVLPQTRVAYDTTEAASSGTPTSGTLVDNLNHIRYRLGELEGETVIYTESGVPIASGVTVINFYNTDVEDIGGGAINITPFGSSTCSGYLDLATYDSNGNGIVDNSEKLGGQLPEYYAISGHTHPTSSGTGHTIQDNGVDMTTRTNLNFIGFSVEDDSGNDATKVTIIAGSGTGDMLASIYDTNSNNIVDNSEALNGHPDSYFSISGHTHVEADITDLGDYALSNHNHTLDSLSNVTITDVAEDDVLKWNGAAWVNDQVTISGGTGASALSDLTDVSLTNLETNDYLMWDGANWINYPVSGVVSSGTGSTYQVVGTVLMDTTASGTTDYFELTGIASGYDRIEVEFIGRSDKAKATNDAFFIYLNGDETATNYRGQRYYNVTQHTGFDTSLLGTVPASTAEANDFGHFIITLLDPSITNYNHTIDVRGSDRRAATTHYVWWGSIFWESTAAITSIKIASGDGDFVANSRCRIIGYKNQIITADINTAVWDDLRITPGSFDRPGGSDPSYVLYYPNGGGVGTYLTEWAKNNIASFTIQLPHSYNQGEDIYAHAHWTPGDRGNEESGNYVGWKIDYTWANINGNFGDMGTLDLSDACDGTDHKHQMTPEVVISGSGKNISSMLLCNIKRTDTGTDDTWSGTISGQLPLLLEVDFHIPLDSTGSSQRTSK